MPIMEAGMFSNQFSLEPETSTGHQNSHNHYHPHSISDPSSPNNSNAESPATAHSAASIGMSKVHKHEQGMFTYRVSPKKRNMFDRP